MNVWKRWYKMSTVKIGPNHCIKLDSIVDLFRRIFLSRNFTDSADVENKRSGPVPKLARLSYLHSWQTHTSIERNFARNITSLLGGGVLSLFFRLASSSTISSRQPSGDGTLRVYPKVMQFKILHHLSLLPNIQILSWLHAYCRWWIQPYMYWQLKSWNRMNNNSSPERTYPRWRAWNQYLRGSLVTSRYTPPKDWFWSNTEIISFRFVSFDR